MPLFRSGSVGNALRGVAAISLWSSLISPAVVAASQVCDTIASTTNIDVERPYTLQWTTEQAHYWSTACGNLHPACILYPQTGSEVSAIVNALRENNETFAVKSGGHNPNLYFSSVDGGPLLSTGKLNEVVLDPTTETARVGPGNLWNDVHAALEGTGYSTVGGRLGIVGVGGYLLGGGMSFMSTEHGWAANSIVAVDIVFANGTLATITADSHPDLFLALRGGGNAFGIITAFTLQVYKQGDVWGGTLTYLADEATNDKVLAAINRFALDYPDEKAAIIPTSEWTAGGLLPLWVVFLYYNGPTPPPGIFDDFLNIPPALNTCKTRSYADLLKTNGDIINYLQVIKIGTETLPLPEGPVEGYGDRTETSLHVLQTVFGHWRNVTKDVLAIPGMLSTLAFQPLPRGMTRIAKQKGGDLLDLDDSVDRVIMEFDFCFSDESATPLAEAKFAEVFGGVREHVLNFTEQGVVPEAYLPLFYNDGFHTQDYSGRLRPERAQLARAVREEVDPDGLWLKQTGGFKL